MPGVFVLLWSTGFIGAKFGLPYAEPLTFLTIRLSLVACILTVAALAMRAPWPRRWVDVGHIMVAGLLVHGVYSRISTGIAHGSAGGRRSTDRRASAAADRRRIGSGVR